jgi:elongation of very long chain fatty acids protein 6
MVNSNDSTSHSEAGSWRGGGVLQYLYDLENDFDPHKSRQFLERSWPLVFGVVCLYLAFIHLGQSLMRNRSRFDLRGVLIVWNLLLAAFSILGVVRTWAFFRDTLVAKGVHGIICDNTFFVTPVVGFWSYVFTLSKLVELGDTVFIVLRKQPLIFLHWYHHITVLLYCWHGNAEFSATGQVFGIMNFAVHSLMYSYYALKAMRIKVPTAVAFFITMFQLSQMVVGIGITLVGYSVKAAGRECSISDLNVKVSFLMYFSYFVLFANFFYQTYIRNGAKRSVVAKKTEQVISQAQLLAKKAM